jgi:flagellin-like hook-associated protein FlgL
MRVVNTARVAAAGMVLCLGSAAQSATINGNFLLSGNAFAAPGLELETNASSGSFSVTLAQGQSTTLNLFRLWTDEPQVDADDLVARQITAAFSLTNYVASGAINGTSIGTSLFGFLQWGRVDWTAPLTLNYGNGGQLSILLNSGAFNLGLFGLSPGSANGLNITATITNLVDPAPVPLPAAGGLLALALGLVGLRRRTSA